MLPRTSTPKNLFKWNKYILLTISVDIGQILTNPNFRLNIVGQNDRKGSQEQELQPNA